MPPSARPPKTQPPHQQPFLFLPFLILFHTTDTHQHSSSWNFPICSPLDFMTLCISWVNCPLHVYACYRWGLWSSGIFPLCCSLDSIYPWLQLSPQSTPKQNLHLQLFTGYFYLNSSSKVNSSIWNIPKVGFLSCFYPCFPVNAPLPI